MKHEPVWHDNYKSNDLDIEPVRDACCETGVMEGAMPSRLAVGQFWRHKKNGHVYVIMETGVLMQCSTHEDFEIVVGDRPWVVYRNSANRTFIRLESEFTDGRFEKVEP